MNDNMKKMMDEIQRLTDEIAAVKKLNLQEVLEVKTEAKDKPKSRKKSATPDWVKSWNKSNASHGPVTHVVKTTDLYDQASNRFSTKTELLAPTVLASDKRLGVLHEDNKPVIHWATRPTHDGVAPLGLTSSQAQAWLDANPGKLLNLRDEGPTSPIRQQMTRLNKVWKYRNFKQCAHCEAYNTWEARTNPYVSGVQVVHAEIWCYECGAVDLEVSDAMPTHVGSWAPPKETPKQAKSREVRQAYRRERATYALVEGPKTAAQLSVWFRQVEKYDAVDPIMLEMMLRRMQTEGLVVLQGQTWWDAHEFKCAQTQSK